MGALRNMKLHSARARAEAGKGRGSLELGLA